MKNFWLIALALLGMEPALAQKTTPVANAANYNLTAGSSVLMVGPSSAGRTRSLRYQGTEMLYVGGSLNWGSTLWPSPQAYWTTACRTANNNGCWPPATVLDADATSYTGGLISSDTTVSYTGTRDANTQLRIRKTLWANQNDSTFTHRYTMVNTSTTASIAFAPWEVTRFPSGGLTFYPKSALDVIGGNGTAGAALIAMVTDTLGIKWFKYDSASIPTSGTAKTWDGGTEGWHAHVDKSRILFIKKFKDTPTAKKAPVSENEIEMYASPRTGTAGGMVYQEMELQGPFDTIPANDSVSWDVKWVVRKLPDSIAVSRNSALLNFVNQTLAGVSGPVALHRGIPVDFFALGYSNGRVNLNLDRTANLSLSLVTPTGREIRRLHSGNLSSGHHVFTVNSLLPHGVYWLILKNIDTQRLMKTRMLVRF